MSRALENRAHQVKCTSTLFVPFILYTIYTCAKELKTNQKGEIS